MRRRLMAATAACMLAVVTSAHAASIFVQPTLFGSRIVLTGDIVPGDEHQFRAALEKTKGYTWVSLNSRGGVIVIAIAIGRMVRARGLTTTTTPNITPLAYDLDAVCLLLSLKRRFLMEWLRKHPCDDDGRPLYRKAGRTKLFTENDIDRILAALLPRPEALPSCPSNSSRRARVIRRGTSGGNTSESTFIAALELAREQSRRKSLPVGKRRSNVVAMPARRIRPSPARP